MASLTLTSPISLSTLPKPTISFSNSSLFITQSTSNFFLRSVTNNSSSGLSLTRFRPVNPSRSRKGFSCTCLFGLGVPEIAVIAGVAVLLFGPKKLPDIGRSIGKTVKGFQEAAKEFESELKKPEEPQSTNEATEPKTASDNSEEKENKNVS